MSKALRLSEKWFQRGLWLVAFAFAFFLVGLGGKIVANLRGFEPILTLEQFIDPVQGPPVRAAQERAEKNIQAAREALEQAQQKHQVEQANSASAHSTFSNWLATRQATAHPDQDPELIARTRALDALKASERKALAAVEAQQQALLDATQAQAQAQARMQSLKEAAQDGYFEAQQALELRVFLYRLMLTLPLLLVAAWLFARKRKSNYWPFVWGFIFFAGFAFFVELVPYLPDYGGFVRYIVGIVLTGVIGRQAIVSLRRYLARQKAAEALPAAQRRAILRYDVAVVRLQKSVCPACERGVDLKNPLVDFCPHCGIALFDQCVQCTSRKNAFARFCQACGTPGNVSLAD